MEWISQPDAWLALVTLTFLETVLGIDNIVFISILTGRLPAERQPAARRLGLLLAMVMGVLLLFAISWIMALTRPWFSVFGHALAGRDLILVAGGLFLMWKAVTEIHDKLEGSPADDAGSAAARPASVRGVLVQVAVLDLVFSLDSVITAVGMADDVAVMVLAILISVGVMVAFVEPICRFVERRPTVRMLALSFLLLIGFTLVAEGVGLHIPKGYVYFAMGFSIGVELLNLRARAAGTPVPLRNTPRPPEGPGGPPAVA